MLTQQNSHTSSHTNSLQRQTKHTYHKTPAYTRIPCNGKHHMQHTDNIHQSMSMTPTNSSATIKRKLTYAKQMDDVLERAAAAAAAAARQRPLSGTHTGGWDIHRHLGERCIIILQTGLGRTILLLLYLRTATSTMIVLSKITIRWRIRQPRCVTNLPTIEIKRKPGPCIRRLMALIISSYVIATVANINMILSCP
jgi:hypothetical protein